MIDSWPTWIRESVLIVTTPEEFLQAYGDGSGFAAAMPAAMRAAMVVSPVGFRINEESASDNAYMVSAEPVDAERALAQHTALVAKLGELGVPALLFAGRDGLDEAVFPNNVFATVRGHLITGAMRHAGRRREAERQDVPALFREVFNYEVRDLSRLPCIAELTGPLVIDRARAVGFCGMTGRVDDRGCSAMHDAFELKLTFRFDLTPGEYHTNLIFAVLAGRGCVLHAGSFADPDVPAAIARAYPERTLFLNDEEKAAFAGNCLAVTERDVLFSATSLRALRPSSAASLENWGFQVHGVEVDELEKGGGSLRCLIAEVF